MAHDRNRSSGRTPYRSCFGVAITGSKEYEIGVTTVVTPVLSLCPGF